MEQQVNDAECNNSKQESTYLSTQEQQPKDTDQSATSNGDYGNSQDNNTESDQKNDTSNLSTAFTISFEDEKTNSSKKLFGIRDSIRKFAPPKPNTIEKSRPPKSDSHEDDSFLSIESEPGLSRGILRRSTMENSDSSRHSNVSESAAFLIDRMLHCEIKGKADVAKSTTATTSQKKSRDQTGDILADEIDFPEDRSDNGTYIVGADPESDAARRKIDELFGVVKSAEENLRSKSRSLEASRNSVNNSRPSRPLDKKPIARERIRQSSRSSSSSRHQSSIKQSRNSSCERTSKPKSYARPRRATSQSSRHSSNHDISDGDTRSSHSSMHHDTGLASRENQPQSNFGMKFNRAFALRRARLGLGEPVNIRHVNPPEHDAMTNLSPKRNMGDLKATSATNSQNLSRTDGGRFSLRMRNKLTTGRLTSAYASSRPNQQGALIDNYVSKVASLRSPNTNNCYNTNMNSKIASYPSSSMPYQSSDELDVSNTSPKIAHSMISNRLHRRCPSDLNTATNSFINNRMNYMDNEVQNYSRAESRTCESVGNSSIQLGALDSLVISAISTLSLKIRGTVCELMVENAKRLPADNETRLVVEEILPQLAASASRPRSPTTIDEIEQSLYLELAQALKNLKKIEQMVDVMKLISNQMQLSPIASSPRSSSSKSLAPTGNAAFKGRRDSNTNSESASPL